MVLRMNWRMEPLSHEPVAVLDHCGSWCLFGKRVCPLALRGARNASNSSFFVFFVNYLEWDVQVFEIAGYATRAPHIRGSFVVFKDGIWLC